MKKTAKIILISLLIIILNFIILANVVQAVEEGDIKIYTKGYFKRIIRNNGIVIKTAHAVYEENGKEYPVYCLNRELHGVGDYIETYNVTNQGKITDLGLWRVIINGYPYKTPEQLGTQDEGEAYTATKQAIYCYIYNTGTETYTGVGEAGNRVINAMNIILENAKKSTENLQEYNIEVKQSEKWLVENNYISKLYEIKSDINISKFKINLENQPKGIKITNLQGQEKNEFNSGENFKILIPIDSLEKSGEFKIKIQTEMETKPIFYGKAPSGELQDYALTAFSYEDVDTELKQNYEKNETKIIIEKQDSATKELLKGAKFEILSKDKKVIRVEETNENGQIILEQILPSTYYVREIKAPEGYEASGELQKIEINMNEKKIIKIENSKIEIPEEPPVQEEPPIEEEPEVEETPIIEIPPVEEQPVKEEPPIIEIPKLPITGM